MKGVKICQVSILHDRLDSRMHARHGLSLHRAGYGVSYVVADGRGDKQIEGIQVWDIGLRRGFVYRILIQHLLLCLKTFQTKSRIVHLHDPELIFLGLVFRLAGKKVIMDYYEDTPYQLLDDQRYIYSLRKFKYHTWKSLEYIILPFYNHIITASRLAAERIVKINHKCTAIFNYPDFDEIHQVPSQNKIYDIIYSGSISPRRGIYETLLAIENTSIRYAIMGDFQGGEAFEQKLRNMKAWKENVSYLGSTGDRSEIIKAMKQSRIGMCNLLITENHQRSLPTKLFEYLASGIPVIATDIPYWTSTINISDCGRYVDPENAIETKDTILSLLHQHNSYKTMAKNGYNLTKNNYSWKEEDNKLNTLYKNLTLCK